jgi:hypothetical protein
MFEVNEKEDSKTEVWQKLAQTLNLHWQSSDDNAKLMYDIRHVLML